jgi:hypothetical protein
MNKYIALFEAFLIADDWTYDKHSDEDRCYLSAACKGKNTQKTLILEANSHTNNIMCFVYLSITVPERHRMATAELVCRINRALLRGNFDFDFRDGEVRFRHAFDIEGGELTPTMIRHLRDSALITADEYHPAFMAIIFGNKTAEEALVTCDEFNQEAQNESQKDATDRADNSKANTSVEAATVH